jgi:hypothetical protein
MARQNLGRAAERRKREYDLRVRHRQFAVGNWVWFYYPRRYKGRSPKWSRMYMGPFLVTRAIPPCNYVIQRSARGKPIVVHADKLKACMGATPTSWLSEDMGPQESTVCPDGPVGGRENNEAGEHAVKSSDIPAPPDATCFEPTTGTVQSDDNDADLRPCLRDRGRLRRPVRFDE